jgi:glycosyltransferase involved in cell wall biosynthesis
MNQPLVSAIISTYNSEEFIKGRLDNLVEQTIFADIEIIIVNSGSEQNEETIINNYLSRYKNIKYLKTQERETIYKAWNRGIIISQGKYVTNANTDDRLRTDALEILSKKLEEHVDCAIVYADQYIVNEPNLSFDKIQNAEKSFRKEFLMLTLLEEYLPGPQSLWRSSLHFKDNIWFTERFEIAGDYDFVCRVAQKYKLIKINDVLGSYYKSLDKKNKELQNINETVNESLSVSEKYAREYISRISSEERKELLKRINKSLLVPKKIYTLHRRFWQKYRPRYHIPSRVFYSFIGSLISEYEGDVKTAISYCERYRGDFDAPLISRQLEHLEKK